MCPYPTSGGCWSLLAAQPAKYRIKMAARASSKGQHTGTACLCSPALSGRKPVPSLVKYLSVASTRTLRPNAKCLGEEAKQRQVEGEQREPYVLHRHRENHTVSWRQRSVMLQTQASFHRSINCFTFHVR